MQITGVFLTYLVWDAVLLENTTQLFASMLLALAISAARIVSNSVGKEALNFKGQAVGWFILIMHAITIVSCAMSASPPTFFHSFSFSLLTCPASVLSEQWLPSAACASAGHLF